MSDPTKSFRPRVDPKLERPIKDHAYQFDTHSSKATNDLIRRGLAAPTEMPLGDVKIGGKYRLYDGEGEYVREFIPHTSDWAATWSHDDALASAMAYGPLPEPTA